MVGKRATCSNFNYTHVIRTNIMSNYTRFLSVLLIKIPHDRIYKVWVAVTFADR